MYTVHTHVCVQHHSVFYVGWGPAAAAASRCPMDPLPPCPGVGHRAVFCCGVAQNRVSVCVKRCVCIYVCIPTYTRMCMDGCVWIYVCTDVRIWIWAPMDRYVYACMCVCISMDLRVCVCVAACMCVWADVCVHPRVPPRPEHRSSRSRPGAERSAGAFKSADGAQGEVRSPRSSSVR